MAKVYVVLNGRKNGIFNSWDECQKSILKFKDAAYKSFVSTAEAEEFYSAICRWIRKISS